MLSLDLGKVRVGVAISDELGLLAHPRDPLDGTDRKRLVANVRALCAEEGVTRVLVGLPLELGGGHGVAARRAAAFAQEVADATGLDVELCDERLSTVDAHRRLTAGGTKKRDQTAKVDGAAAAIVLQSWLDARR